MFSREARANGSAPYPSQSNEPSGRGPAPPYGPPLTEGAAYSRLAKGPGAPPRCPPTPLHGPHQPPAFPPPRAFPGPPAGHASYPDPRPCDARTGPLPPPPDYAPMQTQHGASSLNIPPSVNLSGIYSRTGFDMLGLLSKIATRPNPQIKIGPVDFSCSFVVSDARAYDQPIVYVSETFERLTGYRNEELVGQNCRFLQAPDGKVARGSRRQYSDGNVAYEFKKAMQECRECQFTLANYKKGGETFINLITVIPIAYHRPDEVTYFIGFQVDMIGQPQSILDKWVDGSYIVNYRHAVEMEAQSNRLAKATTGQSSKEAKELEDYMSLLDSFSAPLTPVVTSPATDPGTLPPPSLSQPSTQSLMHAHPQHIPPNSPYLFNPLMYTFAPVVQDNPLNSLGAARDAIIVERCQDLILIVSMSFMFLYVAPEPCKRTLEWTRQELVARRLQDFLHPADASPVFRELKTGHSGQSVNICCRFKKKLSGYVYLELRGRLYESQSGRRTRCFILSARSKRTGHLNAQQALVPLSLLPRGGLLRGSDESGAPWEGLPGCLFKVSSQGHVLFASKHAHLITGLHSRDCFSHLVWELFDPQDSAFLQAAFDRALLGPQHSDLWLRVTTDDGPVGLWIRILSESLDPHAPPVSVAPTELSRDAEPLAKRVLEDRFVVFQIRAASAAPALSNLLVAPSSRGQPGDDTPVESLSSPDSSNSEDPVGSAHAGGLARIVDSDVDIFEILNPVRVTNMTSELNKLKLENASLVQEIAMATIHQ